MLARILRTSPATKAAMEFILLPNFLFFPANKNKHGDLLNCSNNMVYILQKASFTRDKYYEFLRFQYLKDSNRKSICTFCIISYYCIRYITKIIPIAMTDMRLICAYSLTVTVTTVSKELLSRRYFILSFENV